MKKEKHEKTTVTVRLTDEEDQVLSRLCTLKKTSKTGYLARLAKDQAKRELLNYAAEEYLEGKVSLSELAKKTGLDVPTIMDEVASIKGEDRKWRLGAAHRFSPLAFHLQKGAASVGANLILQSLVGQSIHCAGPTRCLKGAVSIHMSKFLTTIPAPFALLAAARN
jgi:predicted HTH domain antitoxin